MTTKATERDEHFKVESDSGTIEVRRTVIERPIELMPTQDHESPLTQMAPFLDGLAKVYGQGHHVETRETYEVIVTPRDGKPQEFICTGELMRDLLSVVTAMTSREQRMQVGGLVRC